MLTASLVAEPPAITAFQPGCVQRGTTTEISLNGKAGTDELSVWSLTAQPEDFVLTTEDDKTQLVVSNTVSPGVHWIRLYNQDGATSLLPILVGLDPTIIEVEPNNSIDEATPVESLPVSLSGVLHRSGEVDTYSVSLSQGQTLVASVDAHETFGSPMDAVLQLLDERGFVLQQNDDDHGFDPLIVAPIERTGTYFVRVFCFPATPNSTINFAGGSDHHYRLTLSTGPFSTYRHGSILWGLNWDSIDGNSDWVEPPTGLAELFPSPFEVEPVPATNVMELTAPTVVVGRVEQADQIVSFPMQVNKGDQLRLRVAARAIASHLDPLLRIRQSDGRVVKEIDDIDRDNPDIDFSWTAPDTGTYSIELTDRFGHGGDRYYYELFVEPDHPRVELSVDRDHFVLTHEKPLEIPITIRRLNGFEQALKIVVHGLPDGVVAEPVQSEAKGETSKKVVLKMTAQEAAQFSGPIEIDAESLDETNQTFAITASLKTGHQTTSQLWLTIPVAAKSSQ